MNPSYHAPLSRAQINASGIEVDPLDDRGVQLRSASAVSFRRRRG
jgi:hypothetical protein